MRQERGEVSLPAGSGAHRGFFRMIIVLLIHYPNKSAVVIAVSRCSPHSTGDWLSRRAGARPG